MAKVYDTAESVESIAGGLIPNYHPELGTARIHYVFVDKATQKGGKDVLGKARKLSGYQEWALEKDFVVEVALDKWNELNESQHTALVDHLLERCFGEEEEGSGEMKWRLREPDVQEFSSILERHGAWHEDLVGFVSIARQVNIDEIAEQETDVELESTKVTTTDPN
jgi:hypothetical protein